MKSVRALLPVALIALAPVLAACGGNDDGEAKDDVSTRSSMPVDRSTDASTPASPDTTSASAPESSMTDAALPWACDVVDKIDIATAYGVTPAAGSAFGDGAGCSFAAKDFLTAKVDLGDKCPTATLPSSKAVDVEGATSAMWGQGSGDPFTGELIACSDYAAVTIRLDFQPGYQHEGDPQAQSVGLAETVLKRLK